MLLSASLKNPSDKRGIRQCSGRKEVTEPAPAQVQGFGGGEWRCPLSPQAPGWDGRGCPTHPANEGLVLGWFRELNRLTLRQAGLHPSKKPAHLGRFLPPAFNHNFFPSHCCCSELFPVAFFFFFLAGMLSHRFPSTLKRVFFSLESLIPKMPPVTMQWGSWGPWGAASTHPPWQLLTGLSPP